MAVSDTSIYDPDSVSTPDSSDPDLARASKLKGPNAAKVAAAIWRSRDQQMARREAQWRVNEMRRAGLKNVQLRRAGTSGRWTAWVPPTVENNPDSLQTMNAAAQQARKFTGIMLADPPAPETEAANGEQEERDAAQFAKRALVELQDRGAMNDHRLIRRAFDRSSTFDSAFIWYYMDPYAGGRAPVKVSAGFDSAQGLAATDESNLIVNPVTGLPWPEFKEVYLRPANEEGVREITTDPMEADADWVPEIRGKVLTGRNVRMIPHDADWIGEADGVQIAMFIPFGKLKALYPEGMDGVTDEEKEEMFSFRPARWGWMLNPEERRNINSPMENEDERLVFTLVTYYKASGEFPRGLCLVTAGGSVTLVNEDWEAEGEFGDISLPIPVTQYKQFNEGDDGYGTGLMEILGPGNEIRAKIIADWLEHMTRLNNRKVFVPMHSNLRPEQLRLGGNPYIKTLPGGKPEYEDIPSFPADGQRLLRFTTEEMRNASSLSEIAAGIESPQVQSGRHAQAIVGQVHASLSDVRQNIIDGYTRGCEIQLALMRAFYTRPRRIGWVGEDGAYRENEWTRSDLRRTSRVRLKSGTLTMLSPVAKAQLAEHFAQLGITDQTELREIVSGHIGPMIGFQDDPFLTRIRRQLAAWSYGPPDGWQPQFEQQPVTGPNGQPVVDPQTGLPQMQTVQMMDPVLLGIFRPYPADDLPHVALIRLRELSKKMSTSEFASKPPEWQFGLLSEFQRAQVAGQGTPGLQPGQAPPQPSPAQRTQGPLATPQQPLPTEMPRGQTDGADAGGFS